MGMDTQPSGLLINVNSFSLKILCKLVVLKSGNRNRLPLLLFTTF